MVQVSQTLVLNDEIVIVERVWRHIAPKLNLLSMGDIFFEMMYFSLDSCWHNVLNYPSKVSLGDVHHL